MTKVPLTVRGADKLREELNKLKSQDRPRVIESIAEARAHGDLKENAEYHAAREQQSFIEGRIKEIEAKLSNATVIDVKTLNANGRVVFGATVDLSDEETGEVGAGDAESVNRRRSNCIVGAAPIDCPRTTPFTFEMEEKEDDCSCRPFAMQVGGQTRIVLDCYQTRMVNEVKRTYVCNRP